MESTKMEKSVDLKWPIAPDGYIPNSVIRGWIWTLEKAKEEDEEFYIGQYDENYKSLIRRRNRKEHKITYAKWDYRPELDVRFNIDESIDGVPSEERKRRIWLKGDKKYDTDTSDGQSDDDDVTGKTDGRLGFDFEFQRRKRPEGSTQKTTSIENGVAVADNRDKSGLVSKKESAEALIKDKESNKDLEVALIERGTSKDHKDEQSETSGEEIVVTPHTLDEKIDKKTMQPDSPEKTTQPENMNALLQNADVDELQTIPTTSTVKVQKTMTEMGKVQSRAGKTDSIKLSETPFQKSGSVAARTEMREAKSVEDVAKPHPKTQKLSEASQGPASTDKLDLTKTISESSKPATSEEFPLVPPAHHTVSDILSADSYTPKKGYLEHTESNGPLPSRQTKSPKSEKEPKPQKVVSKPTATRNANAMLVDQKVLGIYKKFKTGKWVSKKAPGRWTSADVAKSSLKYKWSSGELEGFGITEPVHEHGPIEKTEEGEAPRPIGQIGLWKLIMAGVAESMDPDLLRRLIKDRPADLQTSGIDIGQLSGIIDKRSTMSQDGPKRTIEAMPQTGQKVVSPSTTKREVTIDQDASRGRIRDRPTTQSFQQSTDGLDIGGSSGSLDETGTGRLSGKGAETIGQAASRGLSKDRLKVNTEYIDLTIGPGTTDLKDTSQASVSQRKSKIRLGLEKLDSSERLGVVRPLESRDGTEEETLVEIGPGLESQKSFLKSMGQTGLQSWGTQEFDENIRKTGFRQRGATRSTDINNKTRTSRTGSEIPGDESLSKSGLDGREELGRSRASIIGTGPVDKPGTSRSRDLLGLQTVKSMAHTPGLLISSDPEQFIKALSQQKDTKKDNQKPLPKWRQKLYQLIFLYGFCSQQTAKLIAKEKRAKPTTETEKQQEDRTALLYEFLESVPSAVHERVVRRVQFQDVLGQDFSDDDFHYIIPLSGLNNFITWDKFGETEYGKLLFEWERGDEE